MGVALDFKMTITTDEVLAVMDGRVSKTDLSVQIDIAETMVSGVLADVGHSEKTLKHITIYLAAHFTERQVLEDELGDTRVEYDENRREGLRSTSYGQNAIVLDTSGTLSKLGTGPAIVCS